MKKAPWEVFFEEKVRKIFAEKKVVLDIGGGLRIRGNRISQKSSEWMTPLAEKVTYTFMDPVPDYNPDIVGDIHAMPLSDNAVDAIICIAVLEHVENPILATQEMYRTLKPNGYCLTYVPFLYYYHAEKGYYGDYWRFTPDALKYMFKDFRQVVIEPLHGPLEAICKITPLGRIRPLRSLCRFLDSFFKKRGSKNTSGWYVWAEK